MKRDLEAQKASIEAMGRMVGGNLELNLDTWVVARKDGWYSSGKFGFLSPDEMSKFEAEQVAFKTNAKVYPAKVYWGKKYQSICDALNRL